MLPTGQLLCSAQTNQLFLYTPDPAAGEPHHDWRPAHIEVPEVMIPGHSYHLSGTQINGLSQAVCYGDDAGMATNYPIVRLRHPASGQIVYVRTHDFSTMGVATGRHLPHDLCDCMIDIPSSMPLGHWELTVIANGITSDEMPVQIATHHEDHRYFGKVETVRYNRFGDFDGFTLETKNGAIHGFESHEPRIGELARRAWHERTWIEVKVADGHSHEPAAISFLI